MKSKPIKPEINELEEDIIDVEATGPSVAAAKKSKIAIIAASTILTVIVFYLFFFKGDDLPKEKLEPVAPIKPAAVAPSDSGKSIFEFEDKQTDKQKDEVDVLEKPPVPQVPTLPTLPTQTALPTPIDLNNPDLGKELQNQDKEGRNIVENLLPPLPPAPALPDANQNDLNGAQNGQLPNGQLPEVIKEPTDPRYAPIIVFSGVEGDLPSRGVGSENNIVRLKKNPLEELAESQVGVTATIIRDRANTIAQGKLFSAILETAINTEIPGFVRAIISRDVYGESGNQVLIPKGSRLFGSYSSEIRRGQGRVQITWTRLIRPDGVDLAISFNASDQFGRAGIPGEVDNKYSSIVAGSLLTSVIAVAAAAAAQSLSGNQTTTVANANQGTTTVTADATNQAISNVTNSIISTVTQIVNNALDVTPVIRIPQGTRITVIVNSDIRVPFVNGIE